MSISYDIKRLGPARITSPLQLGSEPGDLLADFTPDDAYILAHIDSETLTAYKRRGEAPLSIERAGPRRLIYFDPSKLKVGIVTCGGICPGINDVVRGLVMTLWHGYGVTGIQGFKYGYAGLDPSSKHPTIDLTPEMVTDIHSSGGTILGTSRGSHDPEAMIETLERLNIRLLFTVGGDGTFRGARALCDEIDRRGLKISVIGIPKTIDNDIPHIDHTFGFETAVGLAAEAVKAAYTESRSVRNGIGLVKLMGRHAGFIAANAALATRNVNLVLVPELPFDLEGENGLLAYLERRFKLNKSTVIVVAEGAGQEHLAKRGDTDPSGNQKLGDIGVFLKQLIETKLAGRYQFSLKYIDPSYMIRSAHANPIDSIFCGYLAQNAVHAGMTGRTGMAVGRSHRKFTHLPLELLVGSRKCVDPEGTLWISVLESTGQPIFLTNTSGEKPAKPNLAPPRS